MNQTSAHPFILAPDTTTEDALLFAAEYLDGAAAIVYETADNSTPEYRPLARSGLQQLNLGRAVIEALLARLAVKPQTA
ncbi:hypothetical protein ACCD10_01375 [Pseudomonas sp. Pseusp122]|uniref:hypothetical protein n=1 Tax=unclassified Pseudomonas TaxID=196821 RepID=UPI0039A4AA2C